MKLKMILFFILFFSSLTQAQELPFRMEIQGADAGNITNLTVSQDKRYFAYISDIFKVKLMSFDGQLIKTITLPRVGMAGLAFSPDGSKLLILTRTKLFLYNTRGSLIRSIGPAKEDSYPDFYGTPSFHPNGKYFATGIFSNIDFKNLHAAAIYDLAGNQLEIIKGFSNQISRCLFSPDGKQLAVLSMDKKINIYDQKNQLLRSITGYTGMESAMGYARKGKILFTVSYSGIKIADSNGIMLKNIASSGIADISPDLKFIVKTGWDKQGAKLIISDLDDKIIKSIYGLAANVISLTVSGDNKHIIAALQNGLIQVFNRHNGESAIFASKEREWLMFTGDGYFDCSHNGSKIVAMVKGLDAYGIDQFALQFNRPDLIMERLDTGSRHQRLYYRHLYKKRLRKSGISEAQLSGELHIPTANIIDTRTYGKTAFVNLELSDQKYPLKSYQIFVNDVPLFSESGKLLTEKTHKLREEIPLTIGENKIEVSCINQKGAESYRALSYATYKGKVSHNLYFLGFGVSEYKDPELNLKYAHKDARDLEELFKKFRGYYKAIYTKTYLNKQVTRQNISQAKSFLADAGVDDTFILFIAGHGVHDNEPDNIYYYLTHETDPENLRITAAPFELIEDLLHDIRPRNKLFLMDTCESGEQEDENEYSIIATAAGKNLTSRAIRGIKRVRVKKSGQDRSFLLNKNRYIYNDIFRRSGAIVFSSSRGGEFSYENDILENGLFTEAVIQSLNQKTTDKDGNNKISIDELKEKVIKVVSELSQNLQNPTVDRDNTYQKFSFPLQ
jgi:hypothetical protein